MAMQTMRAMRFLKKTGRKFSLNGNKTIRFNKSKVKCYNCHKRGHFARECRAPRSQDTKHKESTRRTIHVETPASVALESCDGLGGYVWSDQAEEGLTIFSLMAYSSISSNSEVSTDSNYSSSCLENTKIIKEQNEQLLKNLRTSKINAITYKTGLESIEARLLVYKKSEYVYEEDIKILKHETYLREVAITKLRRKLELAQKQKDEIQLTVENFENSSKNLSKLLDCQIIDKCKIGLGYNSLPPPYTRKFLPPKPNLSGLEKFLNKPIVNEPTVKKPVVETSDAMASADKPTDGNPQIDLQDKGVIDSRCSRHMTKNMSYLTDYEEIDGGYVAFGGNPKGGKITGRGIENLVDHKVKVIRCDNETKFKNREMNQFCKMKGNFDGKADEGFFVRYSLNSKAFRVFNNKTRILEENLHVSDDGKKVDEDPRQESKCKDQEKEDNVNSTNNVNVAGTNRVNVVGVNTNNELPLDPKMPSLEDISTFNLSSDHEDDEEEANMNNVDTTTQVSPTPTTRIHKDHPLDQVIGDLHSTTQTRNMSKNLEEHGFEDLDFPDKVYKVEKALYGLHQAPRAWYKTLSTYLLDNGFHKGNIDKTLFVRRHKDDILLVQVHVDDIIFGSTKKELCNAFEKMMHEMFQMSSIGELTFFLGLQVKQKQDGIFINQDKYVAEIIKKYGFSDVKNASRPMETQKPLLKDEDGEEVDVHMYRSMIGSLMYLTSSRPNIMFIVCTYVRYQKKCKFANKREMCKNRKNDLVRKRIERVSITYYCCVDVNAVEGQLQALVDGKKIIITESTIKRDLQLEYAEGVDCLPNAIIFEQLTLMGKPKRKDTKLPQTSVPTSVVDEAINEEMDDSLERAATTATSLDAEQDKGDKKP
nr:ribonuclease H-like domain, reverse transcriptase, RNA-dependent DNA polymerase [Tanacetum cinerariifolium]